MKKSILQSLRFSATTLALLGLGIGFSNCGGKEPNVETPTASITPTPEANTFVFEQQAGSLSFTLSTNRQWRITTSGEDWFAITPTSGEEGEYKITINVLANEGAAREGQFTIDASTKRLTFNVQQKSASGKTIQYTPLSKLAEMGENLDQDGITIEEDLRIRAVVTTHFESKQFPFAAYHHIQDEEGNAIVATLKRGTGKALPFGTQITADLKGCKLSNYNGTVQIELNGGDITQVPNMAIDPKEVTIKDVLEGKHVNQYIRIKEVQFEKYENVLYYDGTYSTKRHKIVDKEGNSITLEIWKNCVFGAENVASGSGTLTCVATKNISSKGKTFHNLRPTLQSDIAFTDARFNIGGGGGNPGGGDTPDPSKDWDGGISALREAFNKGNSTVGQEMTLKAILVNAPNANNNSSKNLVLSDGKAGIMVRLSDNGLKAGEINPGDQVEVAVSASTSIQRYNNGALQIEVPKSAVKKVANTHTLAPIKVTLADLMSDKIKGELESRLVKLEGVQFRDTSKPFIGEKNSYHTLEEDSQSAAPEGFVLPSVFSSSAKFNKTGINEFPTGNGTIVGATVLGNAKGKAVCNLFIRSAEDLQLSGPRK